MHKALLCLVVLFAVPAAAHAQDPFEEGRAQGWREARAEYVPVIKALREQVAMQESVLASLNADPALRAKVQAALEKGRAELQKARAAAEAASRTVARANKNRTLAMKDGTIIMVQDAQQWKTAQFIPPGTVLEVARVEVNDIYFQVPNTRFVFKARIYSSPEPME